jgi:hypothetical protein
MALRPAYASTPRSIDHFRLSAANTARDGSGTINTLATGSATGFRVDQIRAKANNTTTAGMIRLFISIDNGSTWKLLDEIPVSAITPSGTVGSWQDARTFSNLVLMGTTNKLGVTSNNAESFDVVALGADL